MARHLAAPSRCWLRSPWASSEIALWRLVEEDFLERLGAQGFTRCNQTVRYGAGGLPPNRTLPCGRVLDVILECIEPDSGADAHLEIIERALIGSELVTRDTCLAPGSVVFVRI